LQKLINLWLINIFLFSLFLLTNVHANNNVNLVRDSTSNTINLLEKQNNTYQPNEAKQMCLMSHRISSVAISVPIGLINGLGLLEYINSNDDVVILSYTLVHIGVAYYLGKYGLTDKFIFNGYIGPNYSHTKYTKNGFNIGGNLSFYTGAKFAKHFSTGFEFDFIRKKQINKQNTKIVWEKYGSSYDSSMTKTYNGVSSKNKFIVYIPLTIKYHFKFNKNNTLSTGLGLGYPIVLGFNKTYNDTLVNIEYSKSGGYELFGSNEETVKEARELRTMIKLGLEYRRNKNILRSLIYFDNYKYLNSVNTFSIEYGRSFK